ncbi:MAG: Plasmid stabilization system [Bacteroidetes bacterium]|nr:MAG: Plasmid stabilization system [Bacteroidota bacterium]
MRIVRDAIMDRVKQLPMHPFMYEHDQLCDLNDGSVRFFTVYHYRISYQIAGKLILIIRVRHTSREPLEY